MVANNITSLTPGLLKNGEIHPAADIALEYINNFVTNNIRETMMMIEAFEMMARKGDRLAEISHESLRKVINGEPMGIQYILGLAWTMRDMHETLSAFKSRKTQKVTKPKKQKPSSKK